MLGAEFAGAQHMHVSAACAASPAPWPLLSHNTTQPDLPTYPAPPPPPHVQAHRLLACVHVCCSNLGHAADELVNRPGAATSDASCSQIQAITAACIELDVALAELPFSFPPPPSLATLPLYQATVVPAAATLATKLQEYWQLPEQLQTNRLEAARAAAARSCAYLRCANLGGEGGALAGTGSSTRCR